MSRLTHFDDAGRAHMVDVGEKETTHRTAIARGRIIMQPETLKAITEGTAEKGDVIGVARIAGIMAAKKTADMIPLCHPLRLTSVSVEITPSETEPALDITARVETRERTGVEMEALHAVSATALTIYDMVKAIDRGMVIEDISLQEKHGGKSGSWVRDGDDPVPQSGSR
ncbi:MAG: cyclic pyranopterin monophosphate synthase MoaC [Chloroflexota bacterium]